MERLFRWMACPRSLRHVHAKLSHSTASVGMSPFRERMAPLIFHRRKLSGREIGAGFDAQGKFSQQVGGLVKVVE